MCGADDCGYFVHIARGEFQARLLIYIPGARDDAFNWTCRTRLLCTLPPAAAVYRLVARERTMTDGRTPPPPHENARTHCARRIGLYYSNMCPKQNPYTASRPSDATRDIILYYNVYAGGRSTILPIVLLSLYRHYIL